MENSTESVSVRKEALKIMSSSVSIDEQKENAKIVNNSRALIGAHSLNHHAMLDVLNNGNLSLIELQRVHLEYREAIVKIFTDALSIAIFNTRQLEPRLASGSKMAARALLTLNCLDEFGFVTGESDSGSYLGSPKNAHYPLFEKVLLQLGLSESEISNFKPSPEASTLNSFLESSFNSYSSVLALLAVAEAQVILFSPPLRNATSALGFDVSKGYYHVHGVSTDEECNADDDTHEDDLWSALEQSMTAIEREHIVGLIQRYLDLWEKFWTLQHKSIGVPQEHAEYA